MSAEPQVSKVARPETLRQARSWDTAKNQYRTLGLCWPCAAQAAEGHAVGFSSVRPPCAHCATIVAGFPESKPNGWRAYPEKARRTAAREAVGDGTGDRPSDGAPGLHTVTHGACGKSWIQHGNLTSHCGACHETFAGLLGFDRHFLKGSCVDPTHAVTPAGALLYELNAEGVWSLVKTADQLTWLAVRSPSRVTVGS